MGFVIIGVAGANGLGESKERGLRGWVNFPGLGLDFRLDDGLPSLLAGGLPGVELSHEARDELGVSDGG